MFFFVLLVCVVSYIHAYGVFCIIEMRRYCTRERKENVKATLLTITINWRKKKTFFPILHISTLLVILYVEMMIRIKKHRTALSDVAVITLFHYTYMPKKWVVGKWIARRMSDYRCVYERSSFLHNFFFLLLPNKISILNSTPYSTPFHIQLCRFHIRVVIL